MDYGWVSIHRQIQSHWLWEDKPFSRGQAWVDLVLMANHSNNKFLLGNELIELEAGSFVTSELKLAARWGWGRKKVRNFLGLLEKEQMVVRKTNNKRTVISIVKYSNFQDVQNKKGQQRNNKRPAKEQQRNTNNNDNNDNNKNNILYADDPALNNSIIKFIEHRKAMKKPMTEEAIKLLIKNLNKLSGDVSVQIEILNQSILNGWQGVFPLKNNQNNQKSNNGGRKEVVPYWMDEKKKKNNFNNYPQREYDIDQLEKELLEKQRKEAGNKTDLSERIAALKEKLGQQ